MENKRKGYDIMPPPTKKPHLDDEKSIPTVSNSYNIEENEEENKLDDGNEEDEDEELNKEEILKEILEVCSKF